MSAGKVRQGGVFVEIGADASKFFAALNRVNRQISKAGAAMQQIGGRMTAIGAAFAAPVALAVRQFASFDDAIRATAAVSGAAGADLQMLNDKARQLGATTSFTAVEVANLMTELGRAGFKPDEINAMTGAVLNLARATGTDAAQSAGIMAATLRQFGLGAESATRAADVLTATANKTFNTVESLGEALEYAGPVAKELGMSLEDTVAILGVLGNVGIQGSNAGTALRRLSIISAGAGKELQALFGVTNVDAAGNLKPLVDILDEINQATSTMSVADRTAAMAQAFGLLGITSANVLSNTAGGVRGLAAELRNAEGTAAKTAKEMDAGLGGSMRIALSAIEGTALAIGDALAPSLQKLIDGIASVAGGITRFVQDNEAMILSFAKGVAIFTGVGAALIGLGASLQLASFAVSGLFTAFVALPASVLASVVAVAKYIVVTIAAGVASVASAAKIAAAWLGSALVGVLGFVGSALAALASYAGGCVAAGAASVASAAIAAAAWLAPAAPIIALGAAIAAVASLAYGFGGQIKSALGGVAGLAGQAGDAIGSAFGTVVSDAAVVFGDLGQTASTTFSGIYEAIASGDLSGAMDILWAGLIAGWTRGVEGLMGYVDSWVATFQNTFTYAGTEIAVIWESMWSGMVQTGTTIGAVLMGVVDNMVNGVMAAFDTMVAAVKKSWNWVQSFIVRGYDLAKENQKVDSEMSARAQQRSASRPGVQGRMAQAATANARTAANADRNINAMRSGADDIAASRLGRNSQRADERRAATEAAEGRLNELASGSRDRRVFRGQADEVTGSLDTATTMDAVRELAQEFHLLAATGALTESQMDAFAKAAETAQDRIEEGRGASGAAAAGGAAPVDPEDLRKAAEQAAASQAEVAGTFSASAAGGMGFGQSLQQKIADATERTARGVERMADEGALAAMD